VCSIWFLQQTAVLSLNALSRLVFVVEIVFFCGVGSALLHVLMKCMFQKVVERVYVVGESRNIRKYAFFF
jgi:hypothetical protein